MCQTPDQVARNLSFGLDEFGNDEDATCKCLGCREYVTEEHYDEDINLCIDCADADLEKQVARIARTLTGHDRRILRRAVKVICESFGCDLPPEVQQ